MTSQPTHHKEITSSLLRLFPFANRRSSEVDQSAGRETPCEARTDDASAWNA